MQRRAPLTSSDPAPGQKSRCFFGLRRLWWTAYLAWNLRGQSSYPFRPLASVRSDQARRVRRMAIHAWRYVPWYREAMQRSGLTPADFCTAEDLARLPILERRHLASDPERLVARSVAPERREWFRTGGSTGTSVQVAHDPAALLQFTAFYERLRAIIGRCVGRRFGYREAALASSASTASRIGRICRHLTWQPRSAGILRAYVDLTGDPAASLAALTEFQPDAMFGTGSAFGQLLSYAQAAGKSFPLPKAIAYTSDELPAAARRYILEQARVPVFGWYGSVECLSIAFECEEHRGLHVNIDHCPLRIVDDAGRTLPAGETGNVVISNLVTQASVLLNYRIGDLAALLPDPCPCGRSLPLLSFLPGREDDLIILPSGTPVHPQTARAIVETRREVWEFQLVQDAPTHFRVLLVAAPDCDHVALARAIAGDFTSSFGTEVTAAVEFVDAIDRTASGKHRAVLSLVRQEKPPSADSG